MIPQALLTHFYGNRYRLRIPAHEGDMVYFKSLKKRMQTWHEVDSIEVDPLTGGVLLTVKGSIAELAESARDDELFDLERTGETVPTVRSSVFTDHMANKLRRFDRQILKFTRGNFDARSLVFLALFAGGLYQISKRDLLPSGVTLVKYAFESLFP